MESLLIRQQPNQRPPNFYEATGESVGSRWTSSIMCGRLMAPNSGLLLTRKGSISLRYITAALAPKRGAETRTTNHISEAGTSQIHPTAASNQ